MRRTVLLLVICLLFVITSPAQTFTKLHDFQGSSDGSMPYASLVQGDDGNLYGETSQGGANRTGTIFKITPQGTVTTIHTFSANGVSDGNRPQGGLLLAPDGNFYGTAAFGGSYGNGTVFKIAPDGTFAKLYSFCPQSPCSDGAQPVAGLALGADGNFYGTTHAGKPDDSDLNGTVFKITPGGVLTTLHKFNGSDGANATGRLVLARDGNFYGTTQQGGYVRDFRCSTGCGTIFRITPQGALTTIYAFCAQDSSCQDGYNPYSGVVQGSDGYLYGETVFGGAHGNGYGTIFKVDLQGDLTTLYSFPDSPNWQPWGELLEAAGDFYGTTEFSPYGNGGGTVFRITPNGTFTILHAFCPQYPCTDGSVPAGALTVAKDGAFYATTTSGGTKNQGTAFTLDLGFAPLSVTKTGSGTVIGGDSHIYCGTICSYIYTKGKQLQLSPVPGPGSTFAGWTGCDQVQGSYCFVTLDAGRNVTAAFTSSSLTLTSLVLKPSTVKGGQLSAGTVTLSGPAPEGGLGVGIASGTPNAAHPPAWIVVPAGKTTASFAVRTYRVKQDTMVNILASTGGSPVSATLTVTTGYGSQQTAATGIH